MFEELALIILNNGKSIEFIFTISLLILAAATLIVNYFNMEGLKEQAYEMKNQSIIQQKIFMENELLELRMALYRFEIESSESGPFKERVIDEIAADLKKQIEMINSKLNLLSH